MRYDDFIVYITLDEIAVLCMLGCFKIGCIMIL
jgi:acyl-coenzyme A synthetase/AMP-(fatty) acid ligase